MIRNFRDRTTEAVFNGESRKGFPADLPRWCAEKLCYLNAAGDLGDLRSPPGNQRPIAGVLCLDRGRPGGGRDHGLSLEEEATIAKKLKPIQPGEVLREEFLVPLKMSADALVKARGLPRTRIERIASEQSGIAADTALRLAKGLGTTAQLWLKPA